MICILTKPVDLANYMEVYNIRKRHPGESVSHIDWADLSKMSQTETLYLLAHGSQTEIEGMTADVLADLLLKHGLQSGIKKIKLVACASGITGFGLVPYCQLLADEIVKQGGPPTLVIGFDGETAVTDEYGKTFAKDKRQKDYPNYNKFSKHHLSNYNTWDLLAEKMDYGDEKKILKNVKKIQPNVQKAFEWLYENNRVYIKKSIKGKTYGIPGQKFF